MQGDHIHASIRRKLAPQFKDVLEEGKIYHIKFFRVVENNNPFRVVKNNFKIIFFGSTIAREIKASPPVILRHRFEFTTFEEI